MKKGDYIKISEDAKYNGQDMRWTEEQTDEKVLLKGTTLFHCSDSKIKEFYPKETCFFEDDLCTEHSYLITLLRDVKVRVYGNEVRYRMNEFNSKIQYLGRVKVVKTGKMLSGNTGAYPEYKGIDNRIPKKLWGI